MGLKDQSIRRSGAPLRITKVDQALGLLITVGEVRCWEIRMGKGIVFFFSFYFYAFYYHLSFLKLFKTEKTARIQFDMTGLLGRKSHLGVHHQYHGIILAFGTRPQYLECSLIEA